MALAVGLTPQLLPAIIRINLAHGANPVGGVFGLAPLPILFLAVLSAIVALYMISAEAAKKLFYARLSS